MKIKIDGKEIEASEGSSILDTALENEIFIPHLCSHPDLEAKGGCRLCSVEIKGQEEAVPSCMTKAEEGMDISIYGEKADRIRKTAMELILATHPSECTGCPKYGKCELQSMYQFMGVGPERWRKKARSLPNDDSNPLIQHLLTRCIRCGRCIRACQDLRGVKVLDYVKDNSSVHAGVPGGKSLKEAGCRFCGACIEVCPTGSIMDALGVAEEGQSYEDTAVPCRGACPAHVDIPRYVRHIKDGEIEKAVAVIREKVPFPAALGSICTHACETSCKRGKLNASVSICRLKFTASINDEGTWKEKRVFKPGTGKSVAVIGAGPAGLTSAYYLAKQGHKVEVFEENEKAGGQCRYGIPAYRLPDEVLDKEISDILEAGIMLHTSQPRFDPAELKKQGFDAVLVAVGTHQGSELPLEGKDLTGVLINTDFLKMARMGTTEAIGKKVAVLGGGNVAYDCARTALRLGAEEVHIVCLEDQENMPATLDEIKEGEEEGVILHDGFSFLRIIGKEQVEGLEIQKVRSFSFNDEGKAEIKLVEDSNEILEADHVIFAVGQKPKDTEKMNLELTHGTCIQVSEGMETSIPGVFAAGDAVTGTRSVIAAIQAGRQSAEAIDKYLGGDGNIDEVLTERKESNPFIGRIEGFAELKRKRPACISGEARLRNFDAYEMPFSKEEAMSEASRCLQCDLRTQLAKTKLWNEY